MKFTKNYVQFSKQKGEFRLGWRLKNKRVIRKSKSINYRFKKWTLLVPYLNPGIWLFTYAGRKYSILCVRTTQAAITSVNLMHLVLFESWTAASCIHCMYCTLFTCPIASMVSSETVILCLYTLIFIHSFDSLVYGRNLSAEMNRNRISSLCLLAISTSWNQFKLITYTIKMKRANPWNGFATIEKWYPK